MKFLRLGRVFGKKLNSQLFKSVTNALRQVLHRLFIFVYQDYLSAPEIVINPGLIHTSR